MRLGEYEIRKSNQWCYQICRGMTGGRDVPPRSAACGCYGCRHCVDVCLPDGSWVKGCVNDLSKNTTVECVGAPEAGCDDWEERDDD